MKILIVDDDPGTLNALKVGLISLGHETVVAEDGGQALKIIEMSKERAEPVKLMVTDLRMPGMNGLELIKSAKKVRPELPAILMTAYGNDDIRKEVMNMDRCSYLEKPFNPDNLLKSISEVKDVKM